jgi:hypothetical protein
MNATREDRHGGEGPDGGSAEPESVGQWTPPASSDQAPGEETVQVNDPYVGGDPPPQEESNRTEDEQHPTGG